MKLDDIKAWLAKVNKDERDIHLVTGLDTRTIEKYLGGGTVNFSTKRAIEDAVRKMKNESDDGPRGPRVA